jgi:hypothetical protein
MVRALILTHPSELCLETVKPPSGKSGRPSEVLRLLAEKKNRL